jgi:tetratricopeptide (TPR) repeat protein
VAHSYEIHGMAYMLDGRWDKTVVAMTEALALARTVKDSRFLARMLTQQGMALGDIGEHEQALTSLKEALTAYEGLDPTGGPSTSIARAAYAYSLVEDGRPAEARPQAERVLADTAHSTPAAQARAHWALGLVLAREEKHDEAAGEFAKAFTAYETAREHDDSFCVKAALAEVRRVQRRLTDARRAADEALAGARRLKNQLSLSRPLALAASARVLLAEGKPKDALPLAQEAETAFASVGNVRGAAAMKALVAELEAAPPK